MSIINELPFPRGSTAFGNINTNVYTPTSTDLAQWEGREWIINNDQFPNNGLICLRCVRNVSGIALQSKRLVTFKTLLWPKQVDGYARVNPVFARPVDDALGSITVPNNDLFYVVMWGACLINTGLAADATNLFSEGDMLVAGTGATSQATTAGRVVAADFTGATSPLAKQIGEVVGRALTARTTSNTATDTLVQVAKPWF